MRLFVSAGNPVTSVPDGGAMERALQQLDLFVSIDLYVTETNRRADYILPAATFLEREDVPLAFLGFYTTPFVQWSEAVVPPRGEARDEWQIIDLISREIGIVPNPSRDARRLGRIARLLKPWHLADILIRTGPEGDRFGLRRGGLSVAKLKRHPHGLVVSDQIATGVLREKVRHGDRRVHLDPAPIRNEVARLASAGEASNGEFPLRLIGLRELRSHNSWMHNSPLLVRGGRTHAARVHPEDAAAAGVEDGGAIRVVSKAGAVEVPVLVTDEVMPGTVALPHGWGHAGGWQVANGIGGVNSNLLASAEPADLEPLAGMAFLNGIPIRLEPVAVSDEPAAEELVAG